MDDPRILPDESGTAFLLALCALLLFSLLGLYMALNATTGLHISDNYESQVQATYAALAGLNHARVLLRGLAFDDLLKGPDGVHGTDASYLAEAKSYAFRYPLPLVTAHSLNILDLSQAVSQIPDDGLINTGFYNGKNGTVLIPATGIGQVAPNPYGAGSILTSRYLVKVTDNNGEATEIAGDSNDSPFSDGDGVVIVRSMGLARTISESTGSVPRLNSVAVFEARFKRRSTWDLGPALVVLGTRVIASFNGTYEVLGGLAPGIGTIDPVPDDALYPDQDIRVAAAGSGIITGGGQPSPSVQEISSRIANPDQALLLSPRYLWDFIYNQVLPMADNFFEGSQSWLEGSAPYIGFFDNTKPPAASEQDPQITVVNGNLQVTGGFSGGGLLVVTGNFSFSGPCTYYGLVLVIGSGNLFAEGTGQGLEGGLFVANLTDVAGEILFGTPSLSIHGSSRFLSNRDAVKMAISLLPVSQVSFREIAGSDP